MINRASEDISYHLLRTLLPKGADLGDVGNEIGIVVAKYINDNKSGYELDSFIAGIKHGVSLADGSH